MKSNPSRSASSVVSLLAALVLAFSSFGVLSSEALAQNPVPFVNQPLVPDATAPGGPEFTLTVNGTGFVSGSVVNWNGSALATHFVSDSQLTATVPAAEIATERTASVTVLNPAPGGASNVVFFVVTAPTSSVSFNLFSSPAAGQYAGPIATDDFNGDGKLDLAVANASDSGTVSILLGDGTGNFAPALSQGDLGGACPDSVSVGDFNGDGKLDLVFADECLGVIVLLGDGTGKFTSLPINYYEVISGGGAVGDFNGDGKLDFAVPYREQFEDHYSSGINILGGDGSGNLWWSSSIAVVTAVDDALGVAVGDFNGDGKLDLAVVFYDMTVILLGDGTGNFTLGSSLGYGGSAVAAGDFNGDGKLDLVVVGSTTSILLGDGTGNFTLASSLGYGGSSVGDFNGDSRLDLAGDGSILLGDGTGHFTLASSLGYGGPSVAVGDFNGDGRLDLAIPGGLANTVSIFLQPSPEVALSPTTISFADQLVGTTSGVQTVTLSNTGTETLAITSVAATGDYAETGNCGASLAAGASCTISVTFTPTAPGIRTGTIAISDNAPGSPQFVNLTGTGAAPAVTLSVTNLTFTSQVLGTTSAAHAVTLTNSGSEILTITSLAASGDFAETNTCGGSIAAGKSCTINVSFTPTASGTQTGTITITDNAPGSPQFVNLTGTGTALAVTLSASTLSVGTQAVRTTSAAHTLTLTNSGNGVLTISGITSSGDFAETNTCGSSVAAGASCTISVTFTPTAPGTRTGTITITDNAPGSPHVVTLTGTGTGPAVSFSAATMSVGGQVVGTKSAAHKITLTDTGNAALSITGMTLSSASFSETNSCGTSLAAGASCTITLTFTPSTAGEITGMLSITDNASGSPHQVTLSGVGQDFTIGPYNLAHTMPAGFSASYDLDLAPEGGFNQDVSLACSGAPQQGTCTVTPASATLDGRNHAVITLRVATGAPADVPPRAGRPLSAPPRWPPALMGSVLLLLAALLLTGFGVTAGNRRPASAFQPRLRLLTPICALLLLTLVWVACGGGGAFVASPPTGGTPSGDYVITVTATSGNLTHAVTVKLTVH